MMNHSDDSSLSPGLQDDAVGGKSSVKRPMNAFMLWSKEKRREISKVDPGLHNAQISKILGEEWKRLGRKEKEPYVEESKKLMQQHKVEHPDYHYKPRQNKLTKALKELSSLSSPLAIPRDLASKIKSLSRLSAIYNMQSSLRYEPYSIPPMRSKLPYRLPTKDIHEVARYPHVSRLYSPSQCNRCTCNTAACPETMRRLSQGSYHDAVGISRQSISPIPYPMDGYTQTRSSGPFIHSSVYGWSVPTLVQRRRPEDDLDDSDETFGDEKRQKTIKIKEEEEESINVHD